MKRLLYILRQLLNHHGVLTLLFVLVWGGIFGMIYLPQTQCVEWIVQILMLLSAIIVVLMVVSTIRIFVVQKQPERGLITFWTGVIVVTFTVLFVLFAGITE